MNAKKYLTLINEQQDGVKGGRGKGVKRGGRVKKTFDQDICRSFVRFFVVFVCWFTPPSPAPSPALVVL